MASPTRNAIFNAAVAAVAGGSAAFALFAMPNGLFGGLVEATGLPSLLSAAQPPLGATARGIAMMSAGFAAFAFVWLLLRALDRPAPVPVDEPLDDQEYRTPRLRRADAHPDAPARRPIFAGEEFGEPFADFADRGTAAESDIDELPAEPDIDELPLDLDMVERQTSMTKDIPSHDPWLVEGDADEDQVHWDEAPLRLQADADDEGITTEELLARLPLPPHETASVSSLLQRLDAGLANCEWPLPADAADAAPPDVDDRLRSVLDDLQRMASGGAR